MCLLTFAHHCHVLTHWLQVVAISHSLGRLQSKHGLPIDAQENAKLNLNFGLVDVVYEWARGVPFREITQVSNQNFHAFSQQQSRLR